jgi:hypothetical protein
MKLLIALALAAIIAVSPAKAGYWFADCWVDVEYKDNLPPNFANFTPSSSTSWQESTPYVLCTKVASVLAVVKKLDQRVPTDVAIAEVNRGDNYCFAGHPRKMVWEIGNGARGYNQYRPVYITVVKDQRGRCYFGSVPEHE